MRYSFLVRALNEMPISLKSLTAEANGVVTAEAKAAFVRAAELDGTLVTPRYYLGLAAEQDGDRCKSCEVLARPHR